MAININYVTKKKKNIQPNSGGYYFCPCCSIHLKDTGDLTQALKHGYRDLHDRVDVLMKTCRSQAMASGQYISYIANMDVLTIEQELHERNVEFRHGETRDSLEGKLKNELAGNFSF